VPNADSYTQRPLTELDDLEQQVADVLAQSVIKQMNWDPGFIFPPHAWADSGPQLVAARMDALAKVKDFEARFRLLFPQPTPRSPRP
jgi:hypothetical protein